MSLRRGLFVLITSMLLVNLALLFVLRRQISQGRSDFISFYSAARILRSGHPDRLYDLRYQYELQQEFSTYVRSQHGPLPFVRPGFDAWIYVPFSYLSYGTALLTWDLLNCGCLLLIALLLRRLIPNVHGLSLAVIFLGFLSFFPVFFTLVQGQDSILLLLLYVLSYRALRSTNGFAAGLFVGLGVCKFPLVVPFMVPFLVRKRWKVVAGMVSTSVVLGMISAATVGFGALHGYPAFLRVVNALSTGINVPTDMPNLRGTLSLAFEHLLTKADLKLVIVVLSLVVLAYGCHMIRLTGSLAEENTLVLEISLNIVITLLVCYHSHVFDLTLLLLPACLAAGALASAQRPDGAAAKLLLWSLGFIFFSPIYIFLTMGVRYPSLLTLLLLLFAAALVLSLANLRRRSTVDDASQRAALG